MSKTTRAQHIEDAATAQSDLNVFYAVIALAIIPDLTAGNCHGISDEYARPSPTDGEGQ